MLLRVLLVTLAVIAAVLWTAAPAHAYGACHAGYTHVGPNGVQHVGYNAAAGPYGSGGSVHASSYGAGGAYHAGYGGTTYGGGAYGGYHTYTPTGGGGAAVGGYEYRGPAGGVTYGGAAVYRP